MDYELNVPSIDRWGEGVAQPRSLCRSLWLIVLWIVLSITLSIVLLITLPIILYRNSPVKL
jgi:hypothetical protein